jgi:hypothetical protein
MRSATVGKLPRRSAWRVMIEKNASTRFTRVPQFVGSRGLRIRVLSCGDAYWRVFRACHYTLRWPE